MKTKEQIKHEELKAKLIAGLELVSQKLIAFKKEKKSKIVVMQGDKIVWLDPE
jgi:hypothetical protein